MITSQVPLTIRTPAEHGNRPVCKCCQYTSANMTTTDKENCQECSLPWSPCLDSYIYSVAHPVVQSMEVELYWTQRQKCITSQGCAGQHMHYEMVEDVSFPSHKQLGWMISSKHRTCKMLPLIAELLDKLLEVERTVLVQNAVIIETICKLWGRAVYQPPQKTVKHGSR